MENYTSLARVMGKMVLHKRAYVCQIQTWDATGGPRKIFCGRRVNTPAHDNALTKVFRALDWPACARGWDVEPVCGVTPDAVTPYPRPRNWEMHMGKQWRPEIEKKAAAYAQQDRAVLFVCLTETQRANLIRWTSGIHHLAFFALWRELVEKPTAANWRSAAGKHSVLSFVPKDVEKWVGGT